MIPTTPAPSETAAPTLRRELGRWDLTAIGINQVIGGAIFLMPAQVATEIGAWSWVGFVLAGLASLLVALCFAEVGSRFEGTGGPYLYTRAAFGSFVAFEVGWIQWFTRASSQASVANGIGVALGFYFPAMEAGMGRAVLLTALTSVLAAINVRGIRHSSWMVNLLTIGKLVPLAVFIAVGLFFVNWSRVVPGGVVGTDHLAAAALLLIFVFGGYDVIGVPAGEATNPRRHLPFAFVSTIVCVALIMALAQIVAQGVLPDLPSSRTPLADAAMIFMGSAGALMIGIGSVVSMTGNNAGQVLTGSRMLYALAEHRQLPSFFGFVHPRFRTPSNAILFTSIVALALALSGSFRTLAIVSAVARLVTYTGVCASTLRLRHGRFEGRVAQPTFRLPAGPLIPLLALVVCVGILSGASARELLGGTLALAFGALLYVFRPSRQQDGAQD
jgi:basic amino acid/polyamine antiporter, APA family